MPGLDDNLAVQRIGDEAAFVRRVVEAIDRCGVGHRTGEGDLGPQHDPDDRRPARGVAAQLAHRLVAIGGDVEARSPREI